MLLLKLISFCIAATVDLSNYEQVKQVNKRLVEILVNQYKNNPSNQGAIPESRSGGVDGFQWYESGIMWGAVLDYIQASGDQDYLTIATQAVTLAAHNGVGSFVGNPGLFGLDQTRTQVWDGKWNDDILWWALPALTGAELFGPKQIMPGGVPYAQLAQRTYDEVWQQWDPKGCGGGIFWSRNRNNPDTKNVKSAITNAQHAFMGARLFKITKDPKYINNAKMVLDWMIRGMNIGNTRGIIEEDFSVVDGLEVLDRSPGCAKNPLQLAYKSGFTAAAFAAMFSATNDTQYITMANGIARKALSTFVYDGVISDSCETVMQPQAKNPPENVCQVNTVNSKGTMIRGLAFVYKYTNDRALQTDIRKLFEDTARRVMSLCDSNWVCNSEDWAANKPSSVKNLHAQINAMELFNALTIMNFAGKNNNFQAPTEAPYRTLLDRFQDIGVFWMIVVAVSSHILVCCCICCSVRYYRKVQAKKLFLREQNFWIRASKMKKYNTNYDNSYRQRESTDYGTPMQPEPTAPYYHNNRERNNQEEYIHPEIKVDSQSSFGANLFSFYEQKNGRRNQRPDRGSSKQRGYPITSRKKY